MDRFGSSNLRLRKSYEQNLTNPSSIANNSVSMHGGARSFHEPTSQRTQQHEWSGKISKLTKVFGEEINAAIFHSKGFNTNGSANSSDLPMASHNSNSRMLVESILQNNDPYHIKCEHLTKICLQCSSTELIDIYPTLLHRIFGFANTSGWGLHVYNPNIHPYEYNPIYNFMFPNGSLFKIIEKLMQEQDAIFYFPCESLPSGIRESIEKGQIPLWYDRKLVMLSDKRIAATFDAEEYFFACFAHFVQHPNTLQQPAEWSGVEDVLYVKLFEEYLLRILPIGEDFKTNSNSLAGSPLVFHSSVNHGQHKPEIWKSPQKHLLSSHLNKSTYINQVLHTSSKAECFLQIICDFWLSVNSEEHVLKNQDYRLPSCEHARMVRILIKYLHLFVNQQESTTQSFVNNHPSNLQLQEFKNVVVPALLYEKLYLYLQHCFKHWQLDSSFRMVLETWLSFIQPWRYIDRNESLSDEKFHLGLMTWEKFVENNFIFYSSFFHMFLVRAVRYDLRSIRDIQLVYRVAKVFSQPTLCELLRKESGDTSLGSDLGTNPTPFQRKRVHFDSTASCTPSSIFGAETLKYVEDLCQRLATAIAAVRHKIVLSTEERSKRKSFFFSRLQEFLMLDDNADAMMQLHEDERLVEYMQQTMHTLRSLFKLPLVETNSDFPGNSSKLSESSSDSSIVDSAMPDCRITENGIVLTDRGRFQIIQGLRQFNLIYAGDPELQPIRSYESGSAVRFWYKVACKFNEKYGQRMQNIYNNKNFTGSLLRRISKKLEPNNFLNNPISLQQSPPSFQSNDTLKPRVSLRFAGSYYFMGYFCWMIVLTRLFGFSWLSILFAMVLISLVCVLHHVDTPPRMSRSQ